MKKTQLCSKINSDLHIKLKILSAKSGKKLAILTEEAVEDLIKKYFEEDNDN